MCRSSLSIIFVNVWCFHVSLCMGILVNGSAGKKRFRETTNCLVCTKPSTLLLCFNNSDTTLQHTAYAIYFLIFTRHNNCLNDCNFLLELSRWNSAMAVVLSWYEARISRPPYYKQLSRQLDNYRKNCYNKSNSIVQLSCQHTKSVYLLQSQD